MSDVEMTQEEIGKRLRAARDAAGLSRANLGEKTGISPKSIEKFEAGTQEVSVMRLRKICAVLKVDPEIIVEGMAENNPSADRTSELLPPFDVDPIDHAALILEAIDALREDGFEGSVRKALAMADDAKRALSELEPRDLAILAHQRGLTRTNALDGNTILDIFEGNPCDAHDYCSEVGGRIVDTAVIGLDLWSVDLGALKDIADRLSEEDRINEPSFFEGWGGYKKLTPKVRPFLWGMATAGKLPENFSESASER